MSPQTLWRNLKYLYRHRISQDAVLLPGTWSIQDQLREKLNVALSELNTHNHLITALALKLYKTEKELAELESYAISGLSTMPVQVQREVSSEERGETTDARNGERKQTS